MKVIITTVQVPFVRGGAELHAESLCTALKKSGHEAEIVTFPFKFAPVKCIADLMDCTSILDFEKFGWQSIDKLIALRFPAYYVNHPDKILWVLHQHRAVYELYNDAEATDDDRFLREKIIEFDNREFAKHDLIYANSKNVASRMLKYNNAKAEALYHPPHNFEKFYSVPEPMPYIFYPSRQEKLKRQHLLIEAMHYVKSPVYALLAGVGGHYQVNKELIEKLGVGGKVRMLGNISDAEKYSYYANAMSVFFGPYDEDYGYITLEAMLSSKPVITCTDAGGPLEFVEDSENGFVVEPEPEQIAEKIDWMYQNRKKCRDMGASALETYKNKQISWDNVVEKLLHGKSR